VYGGHHSVQCGKIIFRPIIIRLIKNTELNIAASGHFFRFVTA